MDKVLRLLRDLLRVLLVEERGRSWLGVVESVRRGCCGEDWLEESGFIYFILFNRSRIGG